MKTKSLRALQLILASLIACCSSCAFDKEFLNPIPIPTDQKEFVVKHRTLSDTIITVFSGENHQPVFLTPKRDTMNISFHVKSLLFPDRHGRLINAWLLTPKNNPNPEVTLFHMHGNSGCLPYTTIAIAPMLDQGIQVLTFDYLGYGFSEGEASQRGNLTSALDAFDYAKNLPEIKNTKIVIYGHSLGGHLAPVVASKRNDQIAGLITEGAFSSPQDISAYFLRLKGYPGFIARILVNAGYKGKRSIKKVSKPVLIIHSSEDYLIPLSAGQTLYKKAREPKDFLQTVGCHSCGPKMYGEIISGKIKKMILQTEP